MTSLQKSLVQYIESHPSCTGIQLAMEAAKLNPDTKGLAEIEDLVESQKILELCYCNPQTPHQIKSLYFPIGTTFHTAQPCFASVTHS